MNDGDNCPVIQGSALGGLNNDPGSKNSWINGCGWCVDWRANYVILKPFWCLVEDVFQHWSELLATGRIETGIANTGDPAWNYWYGAENSTHHRSWDVP
jgi:elongation factor Tu